MDIHLYLEDGTANGKKLDLILSVLQSLVIKENALMADLTDLTTQVSRNKDVTDSAVVLLKGLKASLDAAGTDPAKLAALSASLGSETDTLAAAVVANTPAAGA